MSLVALRVRHWIGVLLCISALAFGAVSTQAQGANLPAPRDADYPGTIRLTVDATDLDRRIFQVQQSIPVAPGRVTLLYPRWLPGTHGPYGDVSRMAGLMVSAGGKPIDWKRDTLDPYAFHVDVPTGVRSIDVRFQALTPLAESAGRVVITPEMFNLQWNIALLYPAGYYASRIPFAAQLRLPADWEPGTALRVQAANVTTVDGRRMKVVEYQSASLETLVDSPVFAGRHVKRVALDAPGTARPVQLFMMGDDPAVIEASAEQIEAHRKLVQQADKLFGSRHFRQYEFLLAVSDRLGGIGLEHHESSENGVRTDYFKDWARGVGSRELLPHEYVHSWNGKYRRPADLFTPNFNLPMQNSLLWLYEGQTQFWGRILAARSGLTSTEQAIDQFARVAASYETRAGRTWRNLQDTTNEGTIRAARDKQWRDWERSADYYDEATLIWLEVDMILREKTGGAKSMDDFARAFFGVEDTRRTGPNAEIRALTYTFDDVINTLNGIAAHDWRGLLRERMDARGGNAALDGLKRAGWRLTWSTEPSKFVPPWARRGQQEADFAYSLGLMVNNEGRITSVAWDSPAFKAGLAPQMQIMAVADRSYSAERLTTAVKGNTEGKAPIELIVKDADAWKRVRIDYRGGLRFPKLERIEGAQERLGTLLGAR
ncbi:M61 family metallopeptidase [Piscinibacterium candidicorallinum]|uniref:M61 family metallopeptidase n=1 Tax=Piscinibacterium candidicorallinum TaxID=1793872 RepID=A0ABV7GYJ1_9BURK